MKLLFVSPPFAGHLNPQVPLAVAAREAGHDCTFFTGAAKAAALRAAGFRVLVPERIAPFAMEAIANWPRRATASPFEVARQLRANLDVLTPLAAEIGEALARERPDVAVVDFIAAVSGTWCERLGIPWITTVPTPLALEARRGPPHYLGGLLPWPGPFGAVRDGAGWLAIRTFKRLVFAALAPRLRPLLPRLYRSDGSEAIYSPYRILGLGLTELEFPRDWPASFEMIGPVVGEPESAQPIELPQGRPCALVSIGTHLLWAKQRLIDDVGRLADALPGWHFVVSLGRPDDPVPPRHPAPNVTVVPFVPYQRDLARFTVVVHHGGAGVTYATIAAGRPALVVPHDYDQFDFAARVVHHGLGLRVPRLGDPAAADALQHLARHEDWPRVASFQRAAQRYRPKSRFLAALEEVRAMAAGGGQE